MVHHECSCIKLSDKCQFLLGLRRKRTGMKMMVLQCTEIVHKIDARQKYSTCGIVVKIRIAKSVVETHIKANKKQIWILTLPHLCNNLPRTVALLQQCTATAVPQQRPLQWRRCRYRYSGLLRTASPLQRIDCISLSYRYSILKCVATVRS